jgi:hypothetical protein
MTTVFGRLNGPAGAIHAENHRSTRQNLPGDPAGSAGRREGRGRPATFAINGFKALSIFRHSAHALQGAYSWARKSHRILIMRQYPFHQHKYKKIFLT